MDVLTKQKSKLPQISDVFFVMIHFQGPSLNLSKLDTRYPVVQLCLIIFGHLLCGAICSHLFRGTMQLMGSRYSEARCRCYGNDSSPFTIESLAVSCMYSIEKLKMAK